MLKTILSISGKSGLYKLISHGKNMLIVETLDQQKKRMPIYGADKVISLGDIAMYTDEDEVPLREVFAKVSEKEQGASCPIDVKKASASELREFMVSVLPNYDQDRVYNNDIKKLISWYNILVANGITDFTSSEDVVEPDSQASTEEV
ncbi:MAG: DUF5606 domain-containing protein [Bacteroidaceae bacterium]|nr:DUF5606 domain-containing protein [Bacteroidaceae bacterium]